MNSPKNSKMKNNTILLVLTLLFFGSVSAQVLYNEDFENFTIGNVSDSSNGQTAGQGGWFAASSLTQQNSMPFEYLFQIQNEPTKGKVITMAPHPYPYAIGNTSIRKDLKAVINNRTTGNDVIKLKIDFYTAQKANPLSSAIDFGLSRIFNINNSATNVIAGFNFDNDTGELKGTHYDESLMNNRKYQFNLADNNQPLILPFNTWVCCVVHADYINNKVVFEIPSFGVLVERNFFVDVPYPTNVTNYVPDSFSAITYLGEQTSAKLPTYKFDNIKITALNQVLSTQAVLSSHFNLYPNPAIDFVTITSNKNLKVEQIKVYDLTGKLISSPKFAHEEEIQLNVEKLTIGTYLLHLQTNEGLAIKKLVKK